MLWNILICIGAFLMMELFSWLIHKYIMHGMLWNIHKTHHLPGKGFFEWNDLFSIFFGSIAISLLLIGLKQMDYRFWMGLGIALYGIVYFILHDMIIHGRVKWIRSTNNRYLKALIRAHKMHHKHSDREGSESFGLLWVNRKYFN